MADTPHNTPCPDVAYRRPRRLLLAASAVYAAFVIYGSLVPFAFRPMPWGDAITRFTHTLANTHYQTSRSDVAVNVLLMAPLAMLLIGAIAYRRRPLAAVVGAAAALVACATLSTAVEFAQTFFPPRMPSRTDIAAQLFGAVLGVAIWFVAGRNLVDGLRRPRAAGGYPNQAAALLTGYVVFLVILQTVPFDFATSPVELYRKWRDGAVNLLPFGYPARSTLDAINVALLNAVQYIPLGILGWLSRSARPAARCTHPAVLIIGVPALAEAAQLLVLSRVADVTDILTGTAGALAGWSAAAALQWQPANGRQWPRIAVWSVLAAGWLAVAMFVYWQPLDFHFSRQMFLDKLAAVSLVPLADYQSTTPYNAIDQCATKVLLFVPFGALLGAACRGVRSDRRTGPAAGRHPGRVCLPVVLAATLVVAVLLEAGQALLPSRYPGLTDIVLGCLGAWAGAVIVAGLGDTSAEPAQGTPQQTDRVASAAPIQLSKPDPFDKPVDGPAVSRSLACQP